LNDYKQFAGIAILSKKNLSNEDQIYFKDSELGGGALTADIIVGNKNVQVVNVHLDSIRPITISEGKVTVNFRSILKFLKKEMWGDSVRSRSARELVQWLGEKKAVNVIMGGDFNTVPFSKTIRIIESVFDDALWPSFDYFTGTYKKLNFPVSPRIDFLFFSPNLYCRDASILPMSPGDHLPVRANIGV
jgi:endonuclease/exonuclease/phosphatase family metal-dependent hydrolase